MKNFALILLPVASIVFLTNFISQMKSSNTNPKIARIWRGYTSVQNAPKLGEILRDKAIPSIEKNRPRGLKGIELFSLKNDDEVMFTTIMYFDSIESVKAFAGEDYSRAHIDPAIEHLLKRFDHVVEHHAIEESKAWR
jgi:hypothetical protein